MNRIANRLPALLVAVLLQLMLVSGAFAHSALTGSTPPQDALLESAPRTVTLEFNEPVVPLSIQLFAPDNGRTDFTGQLETGSTLTVPMAENPAPGTYVLSWRVTSEDGHPIAGSQLFSIGEATRPSEEALRLADPLVQVLTGIFRALTYICLFAGIGASLFATVVAPLPRPLPVAAPAMALAGVGAVVVSVGLQGLDALGLSLTSFADPRVWQAAFATSFGVTALCFVFALLLAAAALTHGGWFARVVAVASLGALGFGMSASGHASAAEPQWLTRPAVFAHAVTLAFWLGALLPLALYLRDSSEMARTALERFSRFIPWAVLPLLVSGTVLFVIQMGVPNRQWLAPYALVMLAKLGLLVVLLALALINRRWLTGPALAGEPRVTARLGLSVRAEIIVAVAILGLVASLRFTPPPRVLSQVYPDPAYARLQGDGYAADLVIDPGRAGRVSAEIALFADGQPASAQALTAAFSQPELGIEPLRREAVNLGGNHWRIEGLLLPVQGSWNVTLDARLSRFSETEISGQVTIEDRDRSTRPPVIAATAGSLQIADPFSRATLPGAPVGGAYFVIFNTGDREDAIISATTPFAASVTPHDTQTQSDIVRMSELGDGIVIPAGQAVRLEPGGLHLMLEPLNQPLVEGTTIPLTLTFRNAGTITIDLPVLGIAASSAEAQGSH